MTDSEILRRAVQVLESQGTAKNWEAAPTIGFLLNVADELEAPKHP